MILKDPSGSFAAYSMIMQYRLSTSCFFLRSATMHAGTCLTIYYLPVKPAYYDIPYDLPCTPIEAPYILILQKMI